MRTLSTGLERLSALVTLVLDKFEKLPTELFVMSRGKNRSLEESIDLYLYFSNNLQIKAHRKSLWIQTVVDY